MMNIVRKAHETSFAACTVKCSLRHRARHTAHLLVLLLCLYLFCFLPVRHFCSQVLLDRARLLLLLFLLLCIV
jgi:hypothetical protein